jgi:hypothetical protein
MRVETDLWVFEWTGAMLGDGGQRITLKGGSAAVRTADS